MPLLDGVSVMAMSLETVTCADADFEESAWLVAVTVIVAEEGKSAGAVYTPAGVIVPTAELPFETPFTLQVTLVFVEFATFAVKDWEFPSRSELLAGVTVTTIAGGGGGGGGGTVPEPPPQPLSAKASANKANRHERAHRIAAANPEIATLNLQSEKGVRGRMPSGMQAKGQRRSERRVFPVEFSGSMPEGL